MRYLSSISLALIVLMALACTAAPAPTAEATPAGPMYSKAEAMAVLKQHLQTKIFPGEPYPCLLVIEDNIRNPNSVTWDASYNNYQRLWEVTATKKPTAPGLSFMEQLQATKYFSWSVYERTGAIVATGDDPINQMC
jgi:hypothetical protein